MRNFASGHEIIRRVLRNREGQYRLDNGSRAIFFYHRRYNVVSRGARYLCWHYLVVLVKFCDSRLEFFNQGIILGRAVVSQAGLNAEFVEALEYGTHGLFLIPEKSTSSDSCKLPA